MPYPRVKPGQRHAGPGGNLQQASISTAYIFSYQGCRFPEPCTEEKGYNHETDEHNQGQGHGTSFRGLETVHSQDENDP